jgi:hypothetical protein
MLHLVFSLPFILQASSSSASLICSHVRAFIVVTRLQIERPASRGYIPSGSKTFISPPNGQIGSGTHSSSYSVVIAGCFPGTKRPGREAD